MEHQPGGGGEPPPQNDNDIPENQTDKENTNQEEDKAREIHSATCKPVAAIRPQVELPGHLMEERIQFMTDHALIGKFIGMWPTECALRSWIQVKWHPKGHITLQLGAKGFFTAIFNCLEDRNRVMDGGPYFFNADGLFLKGWVERFNPDTVDLSWAPVWIRLYSLPNEFWGEESLKAIGNTLGDFVKAAEETKTGCPLNQKPSPAMDQEGSDGSGFIKVARHRRANKKPAPKSTAAPSSQSKPSTSNKFEALVDHPKTQMKQPRITPETADNSKKEESTRVQSDTKGK
eukprot:PITA_05524